MENNRFTKAPDGSMQTTLPSGKRLCIVTKAQLSEPREPDADGVLVVDDRHTGNPSFQIVGSHAIRGGARMREVLDAIIAFDALSPAETPWRRSMDSLLKEWKLHNLAYTLHVYRKSARDVDLDNRDEGKGYAHFFIVAAERVCELVWSEAKRLWRGAANRGKKQG